MDQSSGDPPLLQIEQATVRFGPLVAVREVSLTLRKGDLLGLIGPNGAGKTTLLRTAAGLQPMTSGRVRVLGEKVEPGESVLRHIGFTPDVPSVYNELSVRDFLRFIGYGYDLPDHEIRERTDFWLEKVWLTEKADQKAKQLSRGMKQRLGIARSLISNPSLILLDEPAAGLDPAGRVQFRQLLVSLREQGKAIIISSHILADMAEYCTHIAIMSHGEILRYGTVAQIAGHHDEARCRYTIHLAHPVADTLKRLSTIEDLGEIELDRDRIILSYHAGKDHAAKLLAEMIRLSLPVASFIENRADLEEVYLKSGVRQVD
jgi:ABC-2 type transport system ATP-binding protein